MTLSTSYLCSFTLLKKTILIILTYYLLNKKFGSGALPCKMFHVKIIENNKIYTYFKVVRLSKG